MQEAAPWPVYVWFDIGWRDVVGAAVCAVLVVAAFAGGAAALCWSADPDGDIARCGQP